MRSPVLLLLVATAATACSGDDKPRAGGSAHGGTLVISTSGDPDILFPPLTATVQGKIVNDLVYERLAELGDSLNTVGDQGFEPRLAQAWEWSPDSLSISFRLDPAARWHDGRPVRASDVRFTHRLYANPLTGSPFAAVIKNIDSVSAIDSLTAIFWFASRSPLQFFDAVYPMVVLPEHAFTGLSGTSLRTAPTARAPVGSGRFRFGSWRAGASLQLLADTSHRRGRPQLDRVILSVAPDFNTALARVLGGEADLLEQVPVTSVAQLVASPTLRLITTPGLEYNFIQFNLRHPKDRTRPHPLFGNRALRRALTFAVNRPATIRNVYDTLASVALGPTVRAYPTTDTTLAKLPYSPELARRALDSLGWRDVDGDGSREQNGRQLRFTLSVPSSSRARMNMSILVQHQLAAVGVRVEIDRLEFASFVDRETRRDFDAVFGAWHVDASPGGIRQTWGSSGSRAGSGSNYGSYENPVFDAHVDSALSASLPVARRAHFTAAYRIIVDDAPAIWMAEPRRVLALHRRIRPTRLRDDAWWAHIGDWSIPPESRIARDHRRRAR